jgi:hypothetical protein
MCWLFQFYHENKTAKNILNTAISLNRKFKFTHTLKKNALT